MFSESCVSAVFCAQAGNYNATSGNGNYVGILSAGHWTETTVPLPAGTASDLRRHHRRRHLPDRPILHRGGRLRRSVQQRPGAPGQHLRERAVDLQRRHTAGRRRDLEPDRRPHRSLVPVRRPAASPPARTTPTPAGPRSTDCWPPSTAPPGRPPRRPSRQTPSPNQNASLAAVSCAASSACVAVGEYTPSASVNATAAEVLTNTGGTWNAQTPTLPVDTATGANVNAFLNGVSCSAGQCEAGGGYTDTGGVGQGLLAHVVGSTVTTIQAPQPTGHDTNVATENVTLGARFLRTTFRAPSRERASPSASTSTTTTSPRA